MHRSDSPTVHDPGRRPWALGLLTLLAVLLIAGGVLLFGGGSADDTAAPPSGSDLSIPPLPTTTVADDAAPDFSLDLFDGSRFSLASHLSDDGRPVILNLWASWCPPCRAEMPDLDAAAVANPGVVILGVAVSDDPVAAEGFAADIEITYPAGYDESGRVAMSYPSAGLPATFVISGDGRLLQTFYGRLSVEDIDTLVAVALAG